MLFTRQHEAYRPWNAGAAQFYSEIGTQRSCCVGVRCRLGDAEFEEVALLDTGAEWSVLSSEGAETLGGTLGASVGQLQMETRFGLLNGALYRLSISLLADGGFGHDVIVEGTVSVLHNWQGPTVLGYRGFLERLRVAIDPGTHLDAQYVYFGLCE